MSKAADAGRLHVSATTQTMWLMRPTLVAVRILRTSVVMLNQTYIKLLEIEVWSDMQIIGYLENPS